MMNEQERNNHSKVTENRDGKKESIINDQTGIQYGIEVGHEKIVNPADITKMVQEKSLRKKNN